MIVGLKIESMVMTRKILFHHIPKTAGTALIEQFKQIFPDRVCSARYDAELTVDLIDTDEYVFYHGHYSFEKVRWFRKRHPDTFVFTMFRHPFTRVLSQYYNWIDFHRVRKELTRISAAQPENSHAERLRDKFENIIFKMDFNEFCRSNDPDIAHVVDNLQAQYVTCDDRPRLARLHHAVPNALLHYHFVGLQEFYEPCLRILEAKLGLPDKCLDAQMRSNASDDAKNKGSYSPTTEQIMKIERRNAYDIALFYSTFSELYRNFGEYLPPITESIHDLNGIRL